MPVARTEPKTTPAVRSRLRRRCRRASSQKALAARIWRIRIPVTLTQDEGSYAEARTAAIHWAARGVISSPWRTITLPRGIRVNTLSTETPGDGAPLRGQGRVVGQVRPHGGRQERRDLHALARGEGRVGQLGRDRGLRLRAVLDLDRPRGVASRPEEPSRTDAARAGLRGKVAVVHDADPVEIQPDGDEPVLELLGEPALGQRRERLVADRQSERLPQLRGQVAAAARLGRDRAARSKEAAAAPRNARGPASPRRRPAGPPPRPRRGGAWSRRDRERSGRAARRRRESPRVPAAAGASAEGQATARTRTS